MSFFGKKNWNFNKKLPTIMLLVLASAIFVGASTKNEAFSNFFSFYKHKPYTIVNLSEKPKVQLYKNFITEKEAKHLIELAKSRLNHSSVLTNGKPTVDDQTRSSYSAYLKKSEDAIIKSIEEKVSKLIGRSIEYIEPIQVVHYALGQKYLPHYDYFTQEEAAQEKGQRAHTFLIYLNNVLAKDGGKTVFPHLKIAIEPRIGTALYFRDMDETGQVDPLTLHGGQEILTPGVEKWAVNVWVRDTPYTPR